MTIIKPNSTVLFQGDSITDCNRDRNDLNHLGVGYPLLVASFFSALYPELNVNFINKGISGNLSRDLVNRWENDCLELKPDFISIMIGINDVWRRYDAANHQTSIEEFSSNYRKILTMTRENLDADILLLEPYVLHTPADRLEWRVDLDPKREAVRNLAQEFDCIFVPIDQMFQEAATKKEPSFWCPDGVHPAPAGHGLIANAWLKAVKAF